MRARYLPFLFAVLTCTAVQSQALDDAALQAQYQQALQACDRLKAPQDPAACRKEARNALAAARQGQLDTPGDAAVFRRNAEARCQVFTGQDRADCLARLDAPTHTDGSVQDGGILRERSTTWQVK